MTKDAIAKLRMSLRLTQENFGMLFGVHPMTVSKWERGELEPNAHQEAMMAAFTKAAKYDEVGETLKAVLIGAGIVAAILLLLKYAEKK